MEVELILFCLAVGAVLGFLAGLLGIGGGMLMVPFMMYLLGQRGIAPEHLVKVAIATSLTTILFTSMSSVRAHHKVGAVRWELVWMLAPGIVAGALIGAQLVGLAPARLLEVGFGIFLVYMAQSMLRAKSPAAGAVTGESLPGRAALMRFGALIGGISSIVGAGGAFLTVPYLSSRGVRIQNAVATSAACGFPVALGGALGYIWAGRQIDVGPGMIGFIYLPGLIAMSVASVSTAPLGARTAHRANTAVLKRMFGGLLLSLGLYMLIRSLLR